MRQLEARSHGVPDARFVTIPHPFGQLPRAEALPVAAKAAEEIGELLRAAEGERVRAPVRRQSEET